jgi:hypothetical protein
MLGLYMAWRALRHLRHLIALALLAGVIYCAHPLGALREAEHGQGPAGHAVTNLQNSLLHHLTSIHRATVNPRSRQR